MSTLMLLIATGALRAHEVLPGIATFGVENGIAVITLELTAEAILAGIDLDGLEDTNEAPEASDYDALRALSSEELGAQIDEYASKLVDNVMLQVDDERVPLIYGGHNIDDPGNVELVRRATISFSALLPEAAETAALGWIRSYGTLIVRQDAAVEAPFTAILQSGAMSEPFLLSGGSGPGGWQVFADYIPVGFDHIVPKGLDHILFVLGLFFLAPRLWPLLWQVTAFTLAHTVTLALGALGLVTIPGSIVEPLIAASIVYVAVENLFTDSLNRWRPLVIFGFGLLHGLGFASVLEEFGLPQGQFIPALVGFNIGVEIGQLTVLAVAFLAVGLWFRGKPWYRSVIAIPASGVIAAVGVYWFVDRVFL